MGRSGRITVALLSLALALPVAAQVTPVRADNVRDDINRLDGDIDQADRNDVISEREASRLRKRVDELRDDFQRMNRNGLSRNEVGRLESRINQIRTSLRLEKVDYDSQAG